MLNFNWWVNRKDPQGKQCLRGRISRAGQHWRVRSQCPTSDGRASRSGGRHGVDGVLLPEHAGDRADPDRVRPACMKTSPSGSWSISSGSRTRWIGSERHHDEMWDNEDGFFYDLLHLPNGEAMRLKVRSMVGLLPLCASTVFEARPRDASSAAVGIDRVVQEAPPGVAEAYCSGRRASSSDTQTVDCCRFATKKRSSGFWPTCSTKTNSSVPTAYALCRNTIWSIRSCSISADRNSKSSICPLSPTPECSAGIPTGEGRSGCR